MYTRHHCVCSVRCKCWASSNKGAHSIFKILGTIWPEFTPTYLPDSDQTFGPLLQRSLEILIFYFLFKKENFHWAIGLHQRLCHVAGTVQWLLKSVQRKKAMLWWSVYQKRYLCMVRCSWQCGQEVDTLTCKLSNLGSNLDPAINCHPSVSQVGWFINGCAVPQMDVK